VITALCILEALQVPHDDRMTVADLGDVSAVLRRGLVLIPGDAPGQLPLVNRRVKKIRRKNHLDESVGPLQLAKGRLQGSSQPLPYLL
jgi:hypothetical protein